MCIYFGHAQNVYEICVPHCVHCVRVYTYYIYTRRCIDFSLRVDASGGADGLRTTVVVVVTRLVVIGIGGVFGT